MSTRLFDPMQHPEWISTQSAEWHDRIALESGVYSYPWKSEFDEPRAEIVLASQIAACLNENARVLDVGCGHGAFTKQFAGMAEEVVGIDVIEGYIATANAETAGSVAFHSVDALKPLPFHDNAFDVIYTKKGPWLFDNGLEEGHRILKPGGMVLGLYHCGTDGGFRELFKGLYHPLPDNHLDELKVKFELQLSESNLETSELRLFEEVEYLSRPEDVLIKKCFGQKDTLKALVWEKCLKDVEDIFNQNCTSRGLRVINYHALLAGRKGD
ncbi:methyltransferase domain-containing protein [Paenibacillus rhizovicinus]|uniref:Methyltransferase domain-containing protein n=1 Tax=Paenibacillus rhizovicinus TaxID=2704463 RepID=A0A6C0NZQ5_9BACL|nr:class I SAM-dependent methyltransferase [Paenibacillus rhizovicinus]QHW31707.1 methyltransferase domain-containing protein [Paenibacillus rhizovicinus]